MQILMAAFLIVGTLPEEIEMVPCLKFREPLEFFTYSHCKKNLDVNKRVK